MPTLQTQRTDWPETHAVLEIADLVRLEGSRVYSAQLMDRGVYQSMLCGLTVSYAAGGVVSAIRAHDLEVSVTLHQAAIEQDDGIERNSTMRTLVSLAYAKGNAATLAGWHRELCAWRQSMRAAPRETTAA